MNEHTYRKDCNLGDCYFMEFRPGKGRGEAPAFRRIGKNKYDLASGRTLLLVNIKNDSRLSLISAELDCKVYDTSKPIPKFAPNGDEVCVSGPNLEDLFQKQRLRQLGKECVYKYPFTHTIPEPVLSGKSKEFYFETDKFRMPPIQCALTELRGRARKFWEF